ncbi:DUF3710 domain-containing protein [Rothia sp. ZJ932]|uniref:DUF3710 domain-containing protein n=1 Tax=Rothia sp. ZJ932 TaxID=2810516 RepID=UPI001966EBEE|nr:DUF3710 domain-containing protein [Rothia sp. ZJ932]QRZ60884.1 DUF3710 domain-containing protein [Rothia sp. ZJ932]
MFGFKRKKKQEDAENTSVTEAAENVEPDEAEDRGSDRAPEVFEIDRSQGPFDSEEKNTDEGYLDFGSLLIKSDPTVALRLEVDEKSKNVIAITLQKDQAVVQLQAFAAPKSRGLWDDIRSEISSSVHAQGGRVEYTDTALGRELHSRIPATTPDGRQGFRVATFVGIDGPRWFLRAVFTGEASTQPEARAEMEKILRAVVVHRGEAPMAPRDLLPLKVPAQILEAQAAPAARAQQEPSLQVPQRGPEITQIG